MNGLLMPHEDLARHKQKIAFKDRFAFNKKFFLNLLRISFSAYERKIDICQDFFNGKNVGTIHRKYDFIERVRELGYRGPEQLLYFPGQEKQLQAVLPFFRKHKIVLCKPKNGQQGKGIFWCESESELRERLRQVKEAYIVQEFIPPLKDYRYVYHVDTDVIYRFCYAKVRPEVYGDGQSTLSSLIGNNPEIPDTSKKKLTKRMSSGQLARVPENGEKVELVDSGNISKGAYGMVVKGDDLAALDKVMLPFIEDLKNHCRLELTTYCFDIGVLRGDITPDDVSKKDYVFYEYQIPFGLDGYLGSEDIKQDKARVAKLFWSSLQRVWVSRQKSAQPV